MTNQNDKQKIDAIREKVQEAENTGNLLLMASLLAEDITVIAPGSPVINTKQAGIDFLKSWFDAFFIHIKYESQCIEINGDTAFEWAVYRQTTIDKTTHQKASETGRILWHYKKYGDNWLQSFAIWNTL